MAGSTKYSAAAAKIRTKMGGSLTRGDYDALARMRTVNEIAKFLKASPAYAGELSDIDDRLVHRGQLETALRKSVFSELRSLSAYIPGESRALVEMLLRKPEIEQIINCIYYIRNGLGSEYILSVPTYLFKVSRLDYEAMGRAGNYAELTQTLRGTPYYQILRAYNPERETVAGEFETALYTGYYTELFRCAESLSPQEGRIFRELLGSQIDFLNIVTVLRLKSRFSLAPEEIEKLLFSFGSRIGKNLLHKMVCCSNVEEVRALLANSRYKAYFARRGDVGPDNFYYDYAYASSRTELAYGKPSVNIVVSYINFKNIEIRNLVRIIECVRYRLPYGEIIPQIIGYGILHDRSEIEEL